METVSVPASAGYIHWLVKAYFRDERLILVHRSNNAKVFIESANPEYCVAS
jgi:hypothetical protein